MSQTAHEPSTSRLRLAVDDSDSWENTVGDACSPVEEQCDALADLFMTGGPLAPERSEVPVSPCSRVGPRAANAKIVRESPVPALRPESAPIEAMVLGHLPVLASAWGPQFARFVASGQPPAPPCPVALLRFRAGSLSIELFGVPPSAGEAPEPETDLTAAIDRAARMASRWLVSVDATCEPDLADLLKSRTISALTILTGADDAATVACYRTLKSLLGPDAGFDGEPLPVRIAVMGPHDPVGAGERLARAAETFLGFRPVVVNAGARIEPAPALLVYRGPADLGTREVLAAITRTSKPTEPVPEPILGATVEPPTSIPTSPAASVPQPEISGRASDLAALLPGVRPLALTCPYARDVRFGVGADGSLHALAWDDPAGEAPVASVASAGAWAAVNAELIAAACPGIVSPAERGVVQHVFTREARRLRGLLDSSVKVHLVLSTPGNDALIAGALN